MRRNAAAAVWSVLAACGGDPSGPGAERDDASLSARIDGVSWSPESPAAAVNPSPGLYAIASAPVTGASAYTMELVLRNIGGPGTYPLGVSDQVFGGNALLSQGGSSWSTPYTGAAGEVTITALSATAISGTFEFVATPVSGSVADKTVTQGAFDVPVTGTGGVAAANQGSSFSFTVGGTSYVAPLAASVMFGDTLRFSAINATYRITAGVGDITGVGTYALSDSNRMLTVGSPPGAATTAWSTDAPGGSGSVEITSATPSRVMGTFTATAVGVLNTTTSLTLTGSFNLGGYFNLP